MLFFGPRVKTVSTSQLAERLSAGRPVLLDVREPHEFAAGHVPGAVNVPLGQVAARAAEFDPAAETYVICHRGHRSITATKALMKAGFTDVASVAGGTSAWAGKLEK